MEVWDLIVKVAPVLAIAGAGFLALLRWIDLRQREIEKDEFERVFRLIMIITGQHPDGKTARILDQVAAVWMLKRYRRHHNTIKRALQREYSGIVATPDFIEHVVPEINAMLAELPNRNTK